MDWATRSTPVRHMNRPRDYHFFIPPAAVKLGELLAREGDLHGAERHLSGAVHAAPDDLRAQEELVALNDAASNSQDARTRAQEALGRFSISIFLREELGNPDLPHFADDANRVLNIAAEYMRLGLYQKALDVLSRKYPGAVADQSEPGPLSRPNIQWSPTFAVLSRETWAVQLRRLQRGVEAFDRVHFSQHCRRVIRIAGGSQSRSIGRDRPLSAGNALFLPWLDRPCADRVV